MDEESVAIACAFATTHFQLSDDILVELTESCEYFDLHHQNLLLFCSSLSAMCVQCMFAHITLFMCLSLCSRDILVHVEKGFSCLPNQNEYWKIQISLMSLEESTTKAYCRIINVDVKFCIFTLEMKIKCMLPKY